jgi:hypothetical protein
MQRNACETTSWFGGVLVVIATFIVAHPCYGGMSSATAPQVYECRINGQRVFSDQRCAADATQREMPQSNTMSAREAAIGYRSTTKTPTKRKSAPDEVDAQAKRRARCEALRNDKSTLTSRLRAGYNVKQGERLRDRLRKVDGEYYDLRCSGLQ